MLTAPRRLSLDGVQFCDSGAVFRIIASVRDYDPHAGAQDLFIGGYEKPFLSVLPLIFRALRLAHAMQYHLPLNELIFVVPSAVYYKKLRSTLSWGVRPTRWIKVSE